MGAKLRQIRWSIVHDNFIPNWLLFVQCLWFGAVLLYCEMFSKFFMKDEWHLVQSQCEWDPNIQLSASILFILSYSLLLSYSSSFLPFRLPISFVLSLGFTLSRLLSLLPVPSHPHPLISSHSPSYTPPCVFFVYVAVLCYIIHHSVRNNQLLYFPLNTLSPLDISRFASS